MNHDPACRSRRHLRPNPHRYFAQLPGNTNKSKDVARAGSGLSSSYTNHCHRLLFVRRYYQSQDETIYTHRCAILSSHLERIRAVMVADRHSADILAIKPMIVLVVD